MCRGDLLCPVLFHLCPCSLGEVSNTVSIVQRGKLRLGRRIGLHSLG